MAKLAEVLSQLENSKARHIVSLSGGKDSAALAIYLKDRYPQIPVEYVFCDTGTELPETYEFLDRLQGVLGKQITHLSALDVLGVTRKPSRKPFDYFLHEVFSGFLPSPRSRWCTRVLKIEPFEAHIGSDKAFSYIGIRADENREGYQSRKPPVISDRANVIPVYPFRDDGVQLSDVKRILEESSLGLPAYYKWRSRSGCYFCFYQQVGEWQGLKEEHPDLFAKAAAYEKADGTKRFTWVSGRTVLEIANSPRRKKPNPDESDRCVACHL